MGQDSIDALTEDKRQDVVRLHVRWDDATGQVTNVWADVPDHITDRTVLENVREWSACGDDVARAALDAVGGCWVNLEYPERSGSRVYLDLA